jgi:tellurite resistance protein
MSEAAAGGSKLQHFPITLVPTVMGLTGLAIVLFKAQHALDAHVPAAQAVLGLTTAWFVVLLLVYALKGLRHPAEVAAEFRHPIRINFFAGVSISFLLMAIAYTELGWFALARVLWWIGAPLHLVLLLVILYGWFHKTYKVQAFNPAWFIPVVGPILAPVVGVRYAHPEISWFFFAVGLVYWLVLLSVLVNRIFFHEPLPQKLLPTLFIMIAPPAVGFIAYVKMTGDLDVFARVLFYFGVFNGLMLLTMLDVFRRVPYFVSWWGYTFPLDALTLSLFLMHQKTQLAAFRTAALVMTAVTAVTIAWVLIKTLHTASQGKICVPED